MALNSQLQTYQILTNDVQMLILWLSYFFTTVKRSLTEKNVENKNFLYLFYSFLESEANAGQPLLNLLLLSCSSSPN